MKLICIVLIAPFFVYSCSGKPPAMPLLKTDTTITRATSFSKLFLDSVKLEKFIAGNGTSDSVARQLKVFYASRNYEFAWFTEEGIPEHTRAFWNLHNNYIDLFQDTTLKFKRLHHDIDLLMDQSSQIDTRSGYILKAELELTGHFFEYANHAYSGRTNPGQMQWYIPTKKINQVALLDSFISRDGKSLQGWEPVNIYYTRLKQALVRYDKIEKAGGWGTILPVRFGKLSIGLPSPIVKELKRRFQRSGDDTSGDTSEYYTPALDSQIRSSQKMYGLKDDGIIGVALIQALNIPVKDRIRQLLVNMERMRWLPDQPNKEFIIVNIPEFRLHIMNHGNKVFSMNIIVGKEAHSTVIFSGNLQYIVFNPYWNVPPSIVRNEVLPAIARNGNYLQKMNMEQTGVLDGLPVIRQKPGGANALGRVKFIFPNSFNIYLHDTPVKSLFHEDNRAFSHGCIRLEEPLKLAKYLLRNEHGWTDQEINSATSGSEEKWVTLKEPVAVFMTYFTAWVDAAGALNFRKDIYGHDKTLASHLFE